MPASPSSTPPALTIGPATAIAGVRVIESRLVEDNRGEFSRLFDRDLMAEVHLDRPIVQMNRSSNRLKGTLRGLHLQQAPALEAKLVRCLRGRVFDVAVDLRKGSPTFLQHFAVELSPAAANAIYIPEGCAHGFQTLEDDSEVLYLHTAPYAPENEGGVRHDDPALGIAWPLPVTWLSPRDAAFAPIDARFEGIAA